MSSTTHSVSIAVRTAHPTDARAITRWTALALAAALLLGLTVSCDEGTEMRFDQAQYAAAAGDAVQLKFIAEERKSQGCMLIEAERSLIDQTQFVEKWSVEPASGASVAADGTFTATEPGDYTVTATFGGTAYTTKVVVDESGAATAEPVEEEPAEEPAAEEPAVDPLIGQWTWIGALESNGVLGPGTNAYTYNFRQEGAGYALYVEDTKLCDVSFDGTNVSFTTSLMGSAVFNGVLSGDTITGTQDHEGGRWVGEWKATRVQ